MENDNFQIEQSQYNAEQIEISADFKAEDFYTRQYDKKTIKKSTKNNDFFAVLFTITALLLAFSCANLLSFGLYSSGFSLLTSVSSKGTNYHFVQLANFNSYSDAQAEASQILKKSGAGYIYFDGGYRVFANVYFNLEDAQKVVDKNKEAYPKCTIYTLNVEQIKNIKNLTNAQKSAFNNVVINLTKSIKDLYNIAINLDDAKYDETQAKQQLNQVYTNVDNALAEYDQTINTELSSDLYKFRLECNKFLKNLAQTQSVEMSGNEYSAFIKYQQICCIFNLKNGIKYLNN